MNRHDINVIQSMAQNTNDLLVYQFNCNYAHFFYKYGIEFKWFREWGKYNTHNENQVEFDQHFYQIRAVPFIKGVRLHNTEEGIWYELWIHLIEMNYNNKKGEYEIFIIREDELTSSDEYKEFVKDVESMINELNIN